MAASLHDSPLWRDLYGDPEIGPLFGDAAELRAMMLAEAALARAQARSGIVPDAAAAAITRASSEVLLDPAALASGAAAAGVVAPAFVEAFRAALPPEAGRWLHFGATSQDILDTALVLRLRRALAIIDERLSELIQGLTTKAELEAETIMAARTRMQIATPTTFGARIAVWRAPLIRCRARINEMRPRILVASLAGASGTLATLGPHGPTVARHFAEELGLAHASVPWHAARDGVAECGGVMTLITGSLGKIGLDLCLMMQSEIAEVSAGTGGGSSTMPQKSNAVGPEALVALARANAGMIGRLYEAQIHAHERDGAAWALEWLTLPQIVIAAGAALRIGAGLVATLAGRPEAMDLTMAKTQGLTLAEAAVFALSAHMPRPEAQALVKRACARVEVEKRSLGAILAEMTDAPVDWIETFDPRGYLGSALMIARSKADF